MEKRFITNLQWKDFVLFEWLLNEFHENWGKSIKTEVISTNPFIVQATVEWEKWTYQGIGDADDNNVNKLIARHKIRMAETRAIARALRWYNNIWMCSADELWGDDKSVTPKWDNWPDKAMEDSLKDLWTACKTCWANTVYKSFTSKAGKLCKWYECSSCKNDKGYPTFEFV